MAGERMKGGGGGERTPSFRPPAVDWRQPRFAPSVQATHASQTLSGPSSFNRSIMLSKSALK